MTCKIARDGSQEYFNSAGKYHRKGGFPAVIYASGRQMWYRNGLLHRINGPAVMDAAGLQEWYHNGQLHRIDGPAVVRADGSWEWHVNGLRITE